MVFIIHFCNSENYCYYLHFTVEGPAMQSRTDSQPHVISIALLASSFSMETYCLDFKVFSIFPTVFPP